MTDITNWTGPHGQLLRQVSTPEGEPLFVAKDVCEALGLSNVTEALRPLDEDEKAEIRTSEVSSNGVVQQRKALVVTEPGLYKLMARSNKPEAKAFDRWVRHEVLPTIRKTGSYQARFVDSEALERLSALEQRSSKFNDIDHKLNILEKKLDELACGRASREALKKIQATVFRAAQTHYEKGFFKSLRQARSNFNQRIREACGWKGKFVDLPASLVPMATVECSRIEKTLRQMTAPRQVKLKLDGGPDE